VDRRPPIYVLQARWIALLCTLVAVGAAFRFASPALTTTLLLGLGLGVRHAFEPDHLAAVSALAVESKTALRCAWLGIAWGLGHTVSLLGAFAILSLCSAALPAAVADGFELIVACVLVALGVRAIRRAMRAHAAHSHSPRAPSTARPFGVGIIHGLAGSGALTALALAELPSPATRLGFIATFGVGSVLGMAAVSGLAGWPLARIGHSATGTRWLFGLTGALAMLTGVFWGVPLVVRALS
jgi:hypothetical protein